MKKNAENTAVGVVKDVTNNSPKSRRAIKTTAVVLAAALLLASLGLNAYYLFFRTESYLQDPSEIYIMESGILRNNLEFAEGEELAVSYDFDNEEYPLLLEQYDIAEIAGEGSEFERACRLMHEFAPRLRHLSNYDNHVDMNAIALLDYSLDRPDHGINCRSKAQILNEMCLALGIYSRKVWINPYSAYDSDCHVVNEVWDTSLGKWVMLDITNDQYWIDENGTPLSLIEIRTKGAGQEFCTPIVPGEEHRSPEALRKAHADDFLYIMKNMVFFYWCDAQTVGETDTYYMLFPENTPTNHQPLISERCFVRSPVGA